VLIHVVITIGIILGEFVIKSSEEHLKSWPIAIAVLMAFLLSSVIFKLNEYNL
jgi:hypothetical protein